MDNALRVFNEVTRRGARGSTEMVLPIESGEIPRDISGVLYRNGPGRMAVHGVVYDHLFDGDGFLQRLSFDAGTVKYRSRYVETEQFQKEQAAGRMRYRAFGTNLPGGIPANVFRFNFKNAANTSILQAGDDLLALWEGGRPHVIDPETLACLGPWDGHGALAPTTVVHRMMKNGRPFAAHPRIMADGRRVLSFGLSPGMKQSLILYRLDRQTGQLSSTEHSLPRLTFMHDYVATDDETRIFIDPGVAFHLGQSLLGLVPPAASIHGDDEAPSLVRVFDADDRQQVYEGGDGYVFHYPNGYRDGDRLILDACRMDRFPDAEVFKALMNNEDPPYPILPYPERMTLNTRTGTLQSSRLSDYVLELPTINPARSGTRHRYVYGISDPPDRSSAAGMHGIAKIDTEKPETTYVDLFPCLVGEPLFIPAGGRQQRGAEADAADEDDGYLASIVFDPREPCSLLIILDAGSMTEVARLRLPEPVHVGFHGRWIDGS